MNRRDLRWVGVDKTNLPRLLLGRRIDVSESSRGVEPAIHESGIAVGFQEEELLGAHGGTPSVIVFADQVMVEALSWLKAFAPETSPLSQFARVLSYSDWLVFYEGRDGHYLRRGLIESQPIRWASVILGELLSQTDGTSKLGALPLAHASSCYSMAFAKARLLHESFDVADMCIRRFRSLQEERRLTRRTLSTDDLFPLWDILRRPIPVGLDANVAVDLVLNEAFSLLKPRARSDFASYVGAESGLFSDSIEQRVKAFQMLLMRLNAEHKEPHALVPNLLAAAGAFLVGRSASHVFLLQRVKEKWPAALAWFALIAAIGGPELWDAEWSRAVKGIERVLRSGMDDTGVSAADLSWAEYSWLSDVFEGPEIFADVPKMQARTLSIEIIPGVLCQFRLAGEPSNHQLEPERAMINQMGTRIRELEGIVENFVMLASRSRYALEDRLPEERTLPSPRGQADLRFDEEESYRSKTVRRNTKR